MTMPPSAPTILHVLDHSLPVHSGYAFRSESIFRAQEKRGWRPVALTSSKHEQSWHGPWSPEEEIGGVRYYRTGPVPRHGGQITAELRLMAALARRMLDVARRERPALLHSHSPVLTAIPALWVGRRLGLPVVYEVRAGWEDAAVDHGTYGRRSWKYKLVRALESWVCRRADHVPVLCRGLRDDFIARGLAPGKVTVVPNGVDVDRFAPRPPDLEWRQRWGLEGQEVVGFIGSFYRYEGLDLLVEAAARLAAHRPRLRIVLVGGGEVEDELRTRVARLALGQNVVMPGRIAHDRIPGIYPLMDVLAYPRHSIRLTETVTPLKPLEAMAMGKAVVASDIGGHRELIRPEETGLLFRAGDATALSHAVERLLDEPELRRSLGREAASSVRAHRTWDAAVAAYVDVYGHALARAGDDMRGRAGAERRVGARRAWPALSEASRNGGSHDFSK